MEKTNDENSIYKFHASRLNFVLPEDFTIKEANNPKVICLAQNKAGVLFQVACDGKLQINETFEERMNKVIEKTVDYMKQSK